MERMNVGVIGGTGMVGQNYIRLLRNHLWEVFLKQESSLFFLDYHSPPSRGQVYPCESRGGNETPKNI